MKRLLAIDPGASGGLAWRDADGIVQAEAMPEGMTAQLDRLRVLRVAPGWGMLAVMEQTGTYRKGNAVGGAVKFARHCGHLEAALYALGVGIYRNPAPGVWQKALGTWPKDKPERKRAIREWAARRYPYLSVTLKTADALALLAWGEMQEGKDGGEGV